MPRYRLNRLGKGGRVMARADIEAENDAEALWLATERHRIAADFELWLDERFVAAIERNYIVPPR